MNRGRVVAAVLVTAFGLLVLLWGTGTDSSLLQTPQSTGGEIPLPRPGGAAATTGVREAVPEEPRDGGPVPWEAVIIGLFLLAVLVRLVRWLLARDWEPDEPDLHEEPDEVALLLAATSPEQRSRALAEGDPRNGVVACWVALEDAAARGGLPREPSETSAEFTSRVMDTWSVPPDLVRTLGELYREARFSRHPVTEEMRRSAVAALEGVHDAVRGRVTT